MEKSKLERAYKLSVEKFAKEYVAFGTINQELLDDITKIQRAIRNYDILEEMVKQLAEKMKNNIEYCYAKNGLLKQNSIDSNRFKYIKSFPTYDNYFKISKISTAAEFTQDTAAQPDYFGESRPR